MKKNKYILLISFFAVAMLVSCTDMMDVHSEFIKDGETIYSVKVDSAFTYPGNNRLGMKGYLSNAMQAKSIIVKWKNLDKSENIRTFPYDYTQSPDSFKIEFPVPEGQYLFEVTSVNAQGNSSIPLQVDAKVYGDRFRSYLANRIIQKMIPNITGGAKITFDAPENNLAIVKFEYTTIAGAKKIMAILPSQSVLIIEDVDLNIPASYKSGYLPLKTAIDTFYCDAATVNLEPLTKIVFDFDKASWKIIDFSTQEHPDNEGAPNGPAAMILDGNNNTYWQSEWEAQTGQIPHHITIDMQREFNIFTIDLFRRSGNKDTKSVVIDASTDGTTWVKLGTLDYPTTASTQNLKLNLTDGKRARYIKINVVASNNPPYVSLGEIYVSGKL